MKNIKVAPDEGSEMDDARYLQELIQHSYVFVQAHPNFRICIRNANDNHFLLIYYIKLYYTVF